jgi:hypothetical protein
MATDMPAVTCDEGDNTITISCSGGGGNWSTDEGQHGSWGVEAIRTLGAGAELDPATESQYGTINAALFAMSPFGVDHDSLGVDVVGVLHRIAVPRVCGGVVLEATHGVFGHRRRLCPSPALSQPSRLSRLPCFVYGSLYSVAPCRHQQSPRSHLNRKGAFLLSINPCAEI